MLLLLLLASASATSNCAQTDGIISNNASCLCGQTNCTEASGLFCNNAAARNHKCSSLPSCLHTNGSTREDCRCGNMDCINGYCFQENLWFGEQYTCRTSPSCNVVSESSPTPNAASCFCGTGYCNATASESLLCYSQDSNTCGGGFLEVTAGYCGDGNPLLHEIESERVCTLANLEVDFAPELSKITSYSSYKRRSAFIMGTFSPDKPHTPSGCIRSYSVKPFGTGQRLDFQLVVNPISKKIYESDQTLPNIYTQSKCSEACKKEFSWSNCFSTDQTGTSKIKCTCSKCSTTEAPRVGFKCLLTCPQTFLLNPRCCPEEDPPKCGSRYTPGTRSDNGTTSTKNCLCWAGESCSNTDGTESNSKDCRCGSSNKGTSICTKETGTFCWSDSSDELFNLNGLGRAWVRNKPSLEDIEYAVPCGPASCKNTDMSKINEETCMCKNTVCDAGQYCDASASLEIVTGTKTTSSSSSSSSSSSNKPVETKTAMLCIPPCRFTEGLQSNNLFPSLTDYQKFNWDSSSSSSAQLYDSYSSPACKCGNSFCMGNKNEDFCVEKQSACFPWSTTCDDDFFKLHASNKSKCKTPNQRCECAVCENGFYGSQCKKCPHPVVSVLTDFFVMTFGGYFCCAALYYVLRPRSKEERDALGAIGKTGKEGKEGGEAVENIQGASMKVKKSGGGGGGGGGAKNATNSAGASTKTAAGSLGGSASKAAQNVVSQFRLSFLGRILINQMQIVTVIFSSIRWSDHLPTFLVDGLSLIGNLLSINLPGMMSSPDCAFADSEEGKAWTPLDKWWFAFSLPFLLGLVFTIWFIIVRCHNKKDKVSKMIVIQAGAFTMFVLLFTTNMTTYFRVLDCTTAKPPHHVLMMDPSISCDGKADNNFIGLVLIAIFVGLAYFLLSLFVLWKIHKDNKFEICNTLLKVLAVFANVVMFAETRSIFMTVMLR